MYVLTAGPHVLCLKRFERKKNISLALRAFAQLRADLSESPASFEALRLIIAGPHT